MRLSKNLEPTLAVEACMPKRSSKESRRPRDSNQLAYNIVREATGEDKKFEPVTKEKNPHAVVALGRLGGKKGGKARAEKLTAEERREAARKAAQARWRSQTEALDES